MSYQGLLLYSSFGAVVMVTLFWFWSSGQVVCYKEFMSLLKYSSGKFVSVLSLMYQMRR